MAGSPGRSLSVEFGCGSVGHFPAVHILLCTAAVVIMALYSATAVAHTLVCAMKRMSARQQPRSVPSSTALAVRPPSLAFISLSRVLTDLTSWMRRWCLIVITMRVKTSDAKKKAQHVLSALLLTEFNGS